MEKSNLEILKKLIEVTNKLEDKYYYAIIYNIYNKEIEIQSFLEAKSANLDLSQRSKNK